VVGTDQVEYELRGLRRGRGLLADDLALRIGPALRTLCGVRAGDDPAMVRDKVIRRVVALSATLPADLRTAIQVGLAVHDETGDRFLYERMNWLARHIGRDPRTAGRRVENGLRLLAERMVGEGSPERVARGDIAPDGWYVELLRSTLRLDLELPQLTEERRIVSTVDPLTHVVASVTAPRGSRPPNGVRATGEVVHGGRVVEETWPLGGHYRCTIQLPTPLRPGERHDFGVRFTSYPRGDMRPYYVLTPLRRCDRFMIRVRFGRTTLPRSVRRVDGIPRGLVEELEPLADLAVDADGEVHTAFQNLRRGLSYGVYWSV
jgi:hypothetical protein